MYLAPLNYDRFFHKVFSDKEIAKTFLEDFLGIKIDEIMPLQNRYSITDEARIVEFDYRCHSQNGFFVVDMQQWYKPDISRRFYLYHCLNTGLQLESLKEKAFELKKNSKRKTIDYNEVVATLTIVWMVEDCMRFKDHYIAYSMYPEKIAEFIREDELWREEAFKQLMENRLKLLKILNNKTRNIDFLQDNRLIFAFQPNIVNSAKMNRLTRWFKFAEKTKKLDNRKEDFADFETEDVFLHIIRRLRIDTLDSNEQEYIRTESELLEQFQRLEDSLARELTYDLRYELRLEAKQKIEAERKADEAERKADEAERKADEAERKADEAERKADEARQEADEAKEQASQDKIKIAEKLLDKMGDEDIAAITGLPLKRIQALRNSCI